MIQSALKFDCSAFQKQKKIKLFKCTITMAVNEWDFMKQCYLDTVQLVVCQSKIYFPQKKKKNPQ